MAKIDEYKHPQWQKMRLAALERSRFQCGRCGATEKTLHVNHKKYPKGKIWDCGLHDLSVLCEDCHKDIEDLVSFSREHGEELHKVFDSLFARCKPVDALQLFISHYSGQLDPEANGAFLTAIYGIGVANDIEYTAGENNENSDD